jgi:hypothetical protein
VRIIKTLLILSPWKSFYLSPLKQNKCKIDSVLRIDKGFEVYTCITCMTLERKMKWSFPVHGYLLLNGKLYMLRSPTRFISWNKQKAPWILWFVWTALPVSDLSLAKLADSMRSCFLTQNIQRKGVELQIEDIIGKCKWILNFLNWINTYIRFIRVICAKAFKESKKCN